MPRGRKRIVEKKDYNDLIEKSKEKIVNLSIDLKEEKANLKKLEKDKKAYEAQKEHEENKKKQDELLDLIKKSGKTTDEIRSLLFSDETSEK